MAQEGMWLALSSPSPFQPAPGDTVMNKANSGGTFCDYPRRGPALIPQTDPQLNCSTAILCFAHTPEHKEDPSMLDSFEEADLLS